MHYSPQQLKNYFDSENESRQQVYNLLKKWEYKLKDLEYSKKKELKNYIDIIDKYIEASLLLINTHQTLLWHERESCKRLWQKNEKFKRFIKNQGFNPNDFNWIELSEI